MSRSSSEFRGPIRCMHIGNRQYLPLRSRRINDRLPSVVRNAAPPLPSVDSVPLLANIDRQKADRFVFRPPNREYVTHALHGDPYIQDYLSVQVRIKESVTPLFKQLTMLPMTGNRKASTPSHYREEFIRRVRDARKRSDLKPVEVAAELRIPLDSYIRYETRYLLPHHLLVPFCKVTGADPMELLTGIPFSLGKAIK